MFCHVCLKEEVVGKVDRLELCNRCLKKIKPYWLITVERPSDIEELNYAIGDFP